MNKSIEYRVGEKPKSVIGDSKDIIQAMYSGFSLNVLQEYIFPLIEKYLYRLYEKKKIEMSLGKRQFISLDQRINKVVSTIELSNWIILQQKDNKNNNIFLPTYLSDIVYLKEFIKIAFLHQTEVFHKRISDKDAEDLAKKVLNDLSLDKILPNLKKNHIPPLLKENADFEVTIEKYQNIRTIIFNSKNDIKFSEVVIGYNLFNSADIVYLTFQYSIEEEEFEKVKKRYIGKNFNEALFLLLTYYKGFSYLYVTPFSRGLLDVADPKLEKLNDVSTILLATPFTAPSNKSYFSLFPHIEKQFGSIGSFFEAKPVTGTYSLLPPPSFVFISYCISRIEGWLEMAEKEKRDLRIVFWYPFLTAEYGVVEKLEIKVDVKEIIYGDMNKHLLERLERIKYKKEVINYTHGKVIKDDEDYIFRVFVFST